MKTRDAFWDLAKFFAILLVVFWHTIGESQMSFLQPFIKNFIVNMNMPLFFLISGYFSWDLVKGGDWRKLGKRVMGYFVPLFAFSMIQNSCECLFGLSGYVDSFPKEVLKGVLFNWWYIWVLAFCLVAVFACFRVRIYGRGRVIILLVLVFLGSLFIKHAWWVGSFRHMFPFFIFGLGCKWLNVEESLTVKVGLPCLLLFVLANIFEGTTYQSRLYWYGVDSSWWGLKTDGTAVWWELGHYALGVMGSVGVMWGLPLF